MYQAGWSKSEIQLVPKGYAMHGFGNWDHRAWGQETALMARAIVISEPSHPGPPLIVCCLDLGYVTYAMRSGVVERLSESVAAFDAQRLVLTCTHTHSGPGGCTQDGLYNIVTPGYVPEHVQAIVTASCQAIEQALAALKSVDIRLRKGVFDASVEVAWNRSLSAYNRNPDVTRRQDTQTHLALDREMQLLCVEMQGQPQALLSLFGVHATCCGNRLDKYDADNKGRAASTAEAALQAQGADAPVAIFAQGSAGDVSPFYNGPGDRRRRAAIKGRAHYAYAQANGGKQADRALEMTAQATGQSIAGALDGLLTYVDFTDIHVDPVHTGGDRAAFTSPPCHGVAFFEGTPIDGPGMPGFLGTGARFIARRLRRRYRKKRSGLPQAERDYYDRLYAAQGAKDILMESGRKRVLGWSLADLPLPGRVDPMVAEMKRQARIGALDESDMVPTILPLQIVRLGQIALVCCPGEFTTTAGQRVRAMVEQAIADTGCDEVLLCTYCNDYMGYVTTREEYQQQNYEGGHTIFGQWTLAAFQTCFVRLAAQLKQAPGQRDYDSKTRPRPAPASELAKRSRLTPPAASK